MAMKKLLIEFIGTFFLVTAIAFSANPLAIGLTLAAVIYIGGHVSGGHYNPAVSVALLVRGNMSVADFIRYAVAQILGAACAALVFTQVTGNALLPMHGATTSVPVACLLEVLGTFMLVSVVLAVAATKETEGNFIYGFAIGLTVTAMAFCFGSLSGGAFNPAVGVGPWLVALLNGNFNPVVLVMYGGATIVGGIIAALVHKFVNE